MTASKVKRQEQQCKVKGQERNDSKQHQEQQCNVNDNMTTTTMQSEQQERNGNNKATIVAIDNSTHTYALFIKHFTDTHIYAYIQI